MKSSILKKHYLILIFAATILTVFSCKKDDPPIITPVLVDAPTNGVTITTSIGGRVLDENKEPIAGALVETLSETTTTDDNGIFLFSNISVDEKWAYVTVRKSGYFHGSRSFTPTANSINNMKVVLLSNTPVGSFQANNGGTINLGSTGSAIDFPSNAIVDENGNSYTGAVSVAAKLLDADSPNLGDMMPGNLEGSNTEGEYRILASYGMMAVELTGASGNPLQLMEDAEAELTVPVPASFAASAPSTIPLWYFDEEVGLWREEGEATFNGTAYVGMVSHFSFWNCDAPFPLVELSGKVLTNEGAPLTNVQVMLTFPSLQPTRSDLTDINGCFGGKIPMGETLTLTLVDVCGVFYTTTIGPFSTNTVLPDIIVVPPSGTYFFDISGYLEDCNMAPITNGYAVLELYGDKEYHWVTNGTFSQVVSNCGIVDFDLYGINMLDETQSPVQTYSITNSIDVDTLYVCDEILGEYMHVNYYGSNHFFVEMNTSTSSNYMRVTGAKQDAQEVFELAIYGNGSISPGNTYQTQYIVTDSDYCGTTTDAFSIVDVNVIAFGQPGEYIEASFSGACVDYNNDTTFVSGDFRVIR